MDTDGPDAATGSMLLDSSALVLPSLGVGAGASTRSFLRISTEPPLSDQDEAGWRQVARNWGPHIRSDLANKFHQRGKRGEFKSTTSENKEYFRPIRAFALQLLAGKLPIVSLTLKQFRDSWDTETACYQSLVQGERRIDALHELQEIEQCLHVSITRFPTQPIADVLGLIPKHTKVGREGITDVFEALRPFWLRADLRKELGKNLFERVANAEEHDGHGPWVRQEHPDQLLGWHPATADELDQLSSGSKLKDAANHNEDNVRIMFEYGSDETWKRCEDNLHEADLEKLKQQPNGATYRNVMIWRRDKTLPLMADSKRLNVIDRDAIPDLAAYLESLPGQSIEQLSLADLAESIGSIDPATVLDSVLSRQWAYPERKRREYGKSDFCIHARSFGPVFEDRLFPENEQQDHFWPQDSEFLAAYDDVRIGLALQIHRAVWETVHEAKPVLGDDKAKANAKLKAYVRKVEKILPAWFRPDAEDSDPASWNKVKWDELSDAMKRLIRTSDGIVERDPTIRRLIALRRMVIKQSQVMRDGEIIDPDRRPSKVSLALKNRLEALAAPAEDEGDLLPDDDLAISQQ